MDFFELVQKRQSVRAYSSKLIPPEIMRQILAATSLAPSAGNIQARAISVVSSSEHQRRIAAAAGDQMFIGEAAAVLVFSADPPRSAQKYLDRCKKKPRP